MDNTHELNQASPRVTSKREAGTVKKPYKTLEKILRQSDNQLLISRNNKAVNYLFQTGNDSSSNGSLASMLANDLGRFDGWNVCFSTLEKSNNKIPVCFNKRNKIATPLRNGYCTTVSTVITFPDNTTCKLEVRIISAYEGIARTSTTSDGFCSFGVVRNSFDITDINEDFISKLLSYSVDYLRNNARPLWSILMSINTFNGLIHKNIIPNALFTSMFPHALLDNLFYHHKGFKAINSGLTCFAPLINKEYCVKTAKQIGSVTNKKGSKHFDVKWLNSDDVSEDDIHVTASSIKHVRSDNINLVGIVEDSILKTKNVNKDMLLPTQVKELRDIATNQTENIIESGIVPKELNHDDNLITAVEKVSENSIFADFNIDPIVYNTLSD